MNAGICLEGRNKTSEKLWQIQPFFKPSEYESEVLL